ncbi:hypothetical protein DFJ74DRAFT_770425 [Hyaloraphidium curvatum]|nr:hypothetical protein DFJ74DRAFT_770425 [Hyaloraphidium curvatum]
MARPRGAALSARCAARAALTAFAVLAAFAAPARAEVFAVVGGDNTTWDDRIAAFGPRLPEDGLRGVLLPIDELDPSGSPLGCSPLNTSLPNTPRPPIALVLRGGCPFLAKFIAMQDSGFEAIVVGDDRREALVTMYAEGDTSAVSIPGVFVGAGSYRELRLLSSSRDFEVTLFPNAPPFQLLPLLLASVLLPLGALACLAGAARWRARRRAWRGIQGLPVVPYKPRRVQAPQPSGSSGSGSPRVAGPSGDAALAAADEEAEDVCAICLDEFKPNIPVRMLECGHGYHPECVDPWLRRRRTCPVCKRPATGIPPPMDDEDDDDVWEGFEVRCPSLSSVLEWFPCFTGGRIRLQDGEVGLGAGGGVYIEVPGADAPLREGAVDPGLGWGMPPIVPQPQPGLGLAPGADLGGHGDGVGGDAGGDAGGAPGGDGGAVA